MKDRMLVSIVAVIIVAVVIVIALMAVMVLMLLQKNGLTIVPCAPSFSSIGNTTAIYEFCKTYANLKPTELKVVLDRNATSSGIYSFQSDEDGPLVFEEGTDICDMEYDDLTDNERVSAGDALRITGLYPGSEYTLKLIWAPTGDLITASSFTTSI